jgi:transposase InsO family protein
MFATLHCLNQMTRRYDNRFAEILTDNRPEFAPKTSNQKDHHPFERLCIERGIKHCHTRLYRPQTNGKVERFWRTLNEDLINGTYLGSIDHFKQELLDYMIYYNQPRPYQALDGQNPKTFSDSYQRLM